MSDQFSALRVAHSHAVFATEALGKVEDGRNHPSDAIQAVASAAQVHALLALFYQKEAEQGR